MRFCCRVVFVCLTGLDKNFNQWDRLIDGEDEHLIKGTNVITLQSAIWTAFTRCSTHLSVGLLAVGPTGSTRVPPGALWNSRRRTGTGLWRTCGYFWSSTKAQGSPLPHQQDGFLSADQPRLCIYYLHVHKGQLRWCNFYASDMIAVWLCNENTSDGHWWKNQIEKELGECVLSCVNTTEAVNPRNITLSTVQSGTCTNLPLLYTQPTVYTWRAPQKYNWNLTTLGFVSFLL